LAEFIEKTETYEKNMAKLRNLQPVGEESLVDMEWKEIVENAKINSTKKPSYEILLTHLSPMRISKDSIEIAKIEVLASFDKLIKRLK